MQSWHQRGGGSKPGWEWRRDHVTAGRVSHSPMAASHTDNRELVTLSYVERVSRYLRGNTEVVRWMWDAGDKRLQIIDVIFKSSQDNAVEYMFFTPKSLCRISPLVLQVVHQFYRKDPLQLHCSKTMKKNKIWALYYVKAAYCTTGDIKQSVKKRIEKCNLKFLWEIFGWLLNREQ